MTNDECRARRKFPVVGFLRVTATERGISSVEFGARGGGAARQGNPKARRHLERFLDELDEFFSGSRRGFTVPADFGDLSSFTRRVLECAARISLGETVTYGELAFRAGSPAAARAVGQALGRNPVPLLIPCHRVLAAGGLGGFSSGLELKNRLLAFEAGRQRL